MYNIWLSFIISYLIGSIPCGLILGKMLKNQDIRNSGSGNIGATNAWRVGGKSLGILTLLCDCLKGALPTFLFCKYSPLVVFFVVCGHIFPVWLKFKGGKGVATFLGTILVINTSFAFVFILCWLCTVIFTRISSISSIVSVILTTLLISINVPVLALSYIASATIICIKHHKNLHALYHGTEYKF